MFLGVIIMVETYRGLRSAAELTGRSRADADKEGVQLLC